MAFHCEWQRQQVRKWEEAQNKKNRILEELEELYERLENKQLTEPTRRHYEREVVILEKMFKAYDEKAECNAEDLI